MCASVALALIGELEKPGVYERWEEVGTRLEVIAAAPKDGADASKAIEAAKAEIVAQLQKLESANTELGNRIEGYYVTVRQLESRLKKLETP